MAKPNYAFAKRQRDLAKKQKKEEKKLRKTSSGTEGGETSPDLVGNASPDDSEQAVDPGNDGLVVPPDGTKYVSSVRFGSVSKIAPGKEAEVIATGVPSAASMCYDSKQNQLVIPLNPNNGLAFIPLGR